MSAPRPFTDADCTAVAQLRPQLLAHGRHGGWSWWCVRVEGHATPIVDAWTSNPYYQCTVWFPGASKAAVHAWLETLQVPAYVQKARAA